MDITYLELGDILRHAFAIREVEQVAGFEDWLNAAQSAGHLATLDALIADPYTVDYSAEFAVWANFLARAA